jgi:hypothetical protein
MKRAEGKSRKINRRKQIETVDLYLWRLLFFFYWTFWLLTHHSIRTSISTCLIPQQTIARRCYLSRNKILLTFIFIFFPSRIKFRIRKIIFCYINYRHLNWQRVRPINWSPIQLFAADQLENRRFLFNHSNS